MTLEEELTLAAQAQNGDRAALDMLWDAITPKLYGYLAHTLGQAQLAEDVLQETWLKAIQALPRWEPRGVRWSAWLFAIARNLCKEHWRSARREVPLEQAEQEVSRANSPEKTEHSLLVERLLHLLSEDDREILRLRYIAEFSMKEIAAVLGISPLSARVRVHRALRRAEHILQ